MILDTRHSPNAGFFSHCTVRLAKIMGYYNEQGALPEHVDSSGNWIKYKDNLNDDLSGIFFTTTNDGIYIPVPVVYNSLGKGKTPLECHCSDLDQFTDFNNMNYEHVTPFIRKYFTPAFSVTEYTEYLVASNCLDTSNTIAVCYRGTDKAIETELPSYEQMLEETRKVMSETGINTVILQSDEDDIYDHFESNGVKVVKFDHVARVWKGSPASVPDLITPGNRTSQAIKFLAVMQVLSRCNKIVTNTGNVGLWLCLFRGDCEGVSQYCKGTWHRN